MESDERWLPAVEEAGYLISDRGQLWSPYSKRILRGTVTRDGYTVHYFGGRRPRRRERFVHWMVLEAFVGPRPEGMYGCHRDDNPHNNQLSNLRWGTPSSNSQDRITNGNNPNLNKERCPQGHLLAGANLVGSALADGRRGCRSCHMAQSLARIRRKRGHMPIDVKEYADMKYALITGGV